MDSKKRPLVTVRPFPKLHFDAYHVYRYMVERERSNTALTWDQICELPAELDGDLRTMRDWLQFHRDWYKLPSFMKSGETGGEFVGLGQAGSDTE